MATIQLRKNLTALAVPIPTTAADAEPFYAVGGFTNLPAHVGGNEVGIWDGTAIVPFVSPRRQVELIGPQTIAGVKTFSGAGVAAFAGVANMTFADGVDGDVLMKGAGGAVTWGQGGGYTFDTGLTQTGKSVNLDAATETEIGGLLEAPSDGTPYARQDAGWVAAAAGGVTYTFGIGLAEAGGVVDLEAATLLAIGGMTEAPSDGTPYARQDAGWIAVPPGTSYTFGTGLTETAGTVDLDAATATVIGGVYVPARGLVQGLALAADGQLVLSQATDLLMGGVVLAVAADMDAAAPSATSGVTPALVRALIGAQVSTLATTAKTVVPAINELVAMLAGVLTFAGSYDVLADEVDPVGAGANAPLPLPSAANNGRFVICINAGPGLGNAAPGGPYLAEDWIICGEVPGTPGTYAWHTLSVGGAAVTADNVGITNIPGLVATDVQGALEELQANKLDAVTVLASLTGDGTTASPLDVILVDGGVF